jgi:hypothetical protein
MAEQKHIPSLLVPRNQPLIAIPVEENGQEMVRYFTDEEEAERVASGVDEALSLAGAWSDLDEEEMQQALDRIRHESKPTPPIKL